MIKKVYFKENKIINKITVNSKIFTKTNLTDTINCLLLYLQIFIF